MTRPRFQMEGAATRQAVMGIGLKSICPAPSNSTQAEGKRLVRYLKPFSRLIKKEEEEDTPETVPDIFKSTQPSVLRDERPSRGHGVLSFTKDLSRAYVHIAIENVNPEDIVMFHIHCGKPGQLGPILINFALAGNINEYWADNVLTLELTNKDIEAVTEHATGVVGALTDGCPIVPTLPTDKVKTIAGMEMIAREGELYFNLHTAAQTFFGDIRGQLQQVGD